ncbi:MAG: PAS domain S-box protein [Fibrobacterota bacterium]
MLTSATRKRPRKRRPDLKRKAVKVDKANIDAQALLHELRVRQVELELQNEELHNVQENLETALEKYSNYYDFAPSGYFTLNEQGNILEVNLRGASMVKVLRQQLIGTPFSSLVQAENRPSFTAFFNSVLTTITQQHCELRMLEKNGPGIWALMDGVTVKEPVSGTRNIRLTLTDISKRKTVEDKINVQLKDAQKFLDASGIIMVSLDKTYHVTLINKVGAEILGSDMKTVAGQNWLDTYVAQPDWDKTKAVFSKLLAGESKRPEHLDNVIITKTNSELHFSWTNTTIRDDNQAIIGILCSGEDVTERNKITDTLQSANTKMSEQVEAQTLELSHRQMALEEIYRIAIRPMASLKTLCDQVVESLSKLLSVPYLALRILEQDKMLPISKAIKGVLVPEEPLFVHCNLSDHVVDAGRVYHVKNGVQQLFPECNCCRQFNLESFVGLPILSKSNELLGVLMAMDNKERIFTEDEYHLINIFTEYLVHEIYHIKLGQEAGQDKQMKILGQLTSGVAHEVRNPLNAIMAVSEALFQAIGKNPEYQPYIVHIREQVKRLSALMTELLELGRPIRTLIKLNCSTLTRLEHIIPVSMKLISN